MQWVGGAGEELIFLLAKQEAAVLTALHDDETRSFGLQATPGIDEIRRAREFFGLAIVDDEQVDALEHVMQTLVGDVDPEIHRVGGHEVCLALIEHLHLIVRAHVSGHGHLGLLCGGGELRLPVFEHVQRHLVRGAAVHVVMVLAAPGEGFTLAAFQTVQRDAACGQHVEVRLGEIMADDTDEMDRLAEDAGGQCRVAGGAAEQVFLRILRGFDIIKGDGSGDDD